MTTEVETGSNESQEHQYTEIEQRAIDMGWRPREEFSGEDDDFVDAKEFVGRKPLYDKIASTSKQLKNVTQAIEALKGHMGKTQEAAVQTAIKTLKEQRKQALVEGDADKFEELDDNIKSAEAQVAEIRDNTATPLVKEEPIVHPEFLHWQNRNPWYNNTGYMKEFADQLGAKLANTMTPSDVLKEVEKQVRKEFPNKFSNPNKTDAPETGTSRTSGRQASAERYEMNEQELQVWKTLHRTDPVLFSKENYIKQLKGIK